ncbi:MAG: hypothetical protein RLT87_07545 [Gammaproteobacteria bacterium]
MSLRYQLLVLVSAVALLTACQHKASPETIATTFWKAAVNNNSLIMKRLTSVNTYTQQNDFALLHKTTNFKLGKIVIDANRAKIETTLYFDEPDKPVALTTYLLKEEDKWLIDYQRSVAFLNMNREMTEIMDDIEALARQFADQVEGSVEQFRQKALPEIRSKIDKAEQQLKKKLPELKQQVDQFLDELERSIEKSMPREAPETTRT